MTRRASIVAAGLLAMPALLAAAALLALPAAMAQEAPAEAVTGVIRGAVVSGTEGISLDDRFEIQMFALDAEHQIVGQQTTVAEQQHFEFRVAADPALTYVLRTVHQGVEYMSDPAQLSPERLQADLDLTVFEATRVAPALQIDSTTVTVTNLDRSYGVMTLMREDVVLNPSDRIFVGDATGLTLRFPTPDRTIDAGGASEMSSVRLEGATLGVMRSLRPGFNSVVTHYVVAYDFESDSYRLRVLAPLPTGRMEVRVPEVYVRDAEAVGLARSRGVVVVDGQSMLVFEGDASTGQLLVDLNGISGRNAANPLTGTTGATVGSLLAIALLAGAVLALMRPPAALARMLSRGRGGATG